MEMKLSKGLEVGLGAENMKRVSDSADASVFILEDLFHSFAVKTESNVASFAGEYIWDSEP